MASVAQLHSSHIAGNCHRVHPAVHISTFRSPAFPYKKLPSTLNFTFSPLKSKPFKPSLLPELQPLFCSGGGGGVGAGGGGGRGDDDGGSNGGGKSDDSSDTFGPIGAFLSGWKSRVAADPQFPFKVLMEEVVGVSACVIGDMASRPNFGLTELDFVFSTLVVGSILNFVLMYLLAPTLSATSPTLPSIFANSPTSHMFEPGSFSLMNRFGTLVYKGTLFAAVGFTAGLVGTAISNGLIKMRKKMDPNFEPPNKPPPTLLNSVTWAIQLGVSSNLRYQALNGIELLLAKAFPPVIFKTSVIGLRTANNVLGGMTFVMLAKATGSQTSAEEKKVSSDLDEEDRVQLK